MSLKKGWLSQKKIYHSMYYSCAGSPHFSHFQAGFLVHPVSRLEDCSPSTIFTPAINQRKQIYVIYRILQAESCKGFFPSRCRTEWKAPLQSKGKGLNWGKTKFKLIVLYNSQVTRIVPKFTNPVTRSVACTKSILMVWVNLKSSVITKQPVEDGQCFKRDGMAL